MKTYAEKILKSIAVVAFVVLLMPFISEAASPVSDFEYGLGDHEGKAECTITKYVGDGKDVVIPDEIEGHSVTTLNDYAFRNNSTIESVVVPSSVKVIQHGVFEGCTNLRKVTLSEGVEEIWNSAFANCPKLESIYLPSTVWHVGYGGAAGYAYQAIIRDSYAVKTITVSPDNSHYASKDGILYKKDMTELIEAPNKENIYIPDGVEEIGFRSLENCINLKTLRIPASVKFIENLGLGLPDFTVIGTPGTVAESYAKEKGLTFVDEKAGSWQKDSRGWWYRYADGSYPAGTFKEIGNATYYFKDDGYMATGWKWIEGKWYYFNDNGYRSEAGWQWIDGSCYYFYADGHMAANETVNGSYVNASGAWEYDRWVYSDYAEKYWYRYANGSYPSNTFKTISGKTYYFDASGYMVTGWQKIEDKWYYFDESGCRVENGWKWIGNYCYYFYADGHMAASETVDGAYVNASGAWEYDKWVYSYYAGKYWYRYANGSYPSNTFKTISGKTYYFDASGYMVTGWKWIEGSWYYFEGSGYRAENGWQWIGGSCYYFYADGKMAHDEMINGSYVGLSGAWEK